MIDFANTTNIPGLMFLADFEEAFDKLEWSFLFQAREFFGFGDGFIAWVKTMYTEVKSCVLNNGHAGVRIFSTTSWSTARLSSQSVALFIMQ